MNKLKLLKWYLYFFGAANIATSLLIPLVFGESFLWQPRNLATDLMIGSIYLALGISMMRTAAAPENHKGFIDFVVLANVSHAFVMLVFAQKPVHIYLDAGFVAVVGVLPLLLYPWGLKNFLRYQK